MIDYSVAKESERLRMLIQVLSCVGEGGASIDIIAHDLGFSLTATEHLINRAMCMGFRITKDKGLYKYED